MQEIVRKPAVEGFCGVGGEGVENVSVAGADVFGASGKDGIELLTVVGGDVLNVAHILQSPLNLEGGNAGIEQFLEPFAAVHVAQRKQMPVADECVALGILEGEGQTAELGALPTVGRAPETVLRGVALSAVADAERTMHKDLQRHVGDSGMDVCNLLKTQLAGKHRLPEAQLLQQLHLFRCAVVHLCGGMQGNRGEVHAQQGCVLHDEGIHADAVERPDEPFGFAQFVVVEDGVDGDVDADVERVGIFH